MNGVDVALVVLLLICTVRGFWRGLLRESFGLLALLAGLAVAVKYAAAVAALAAARLPALHERAQLGAAFVMLFLLVYAAINLIGFAGDRLLWSSTLRAVSRVGGAAFACVKGGAILAFVLLFFQLFPVVPRLDEHIMASQIARPMVSVASAVLRFGWRASAGDERRA